MRQLHPLPKFDSIMQNYDVPHTLQLIFVFIYEGA